MSDSAGTGGGKRAAGCDYEDGCQDGTQPSLLVRGDGRQRTRNSAGMRRKNSESAIVCEHSGQRCTLDVETRLDLIQILTARFHAR